MAIAFMNVSNISRGAGRSAVACAAYRAGEELYDEHQDKTHDYAPRSGVLHNEIRLAEQAPDELRDRQTLWNAMEMAEYNNDGTSKDKAKLAREIVIALPHELDLEQNISLLREYADHLIEEHQFGVDMSIHAPDARGNDKNIHAHIMVTSRRIDETGLHRRSAKTRELDIVSLKKPEKDKRTGKAFEQTGGDIIDDWRQSWADHVNQHLEKAQVAETIDMRSYERQGVDKQAETHMGVAATQLERQGVKTEVGNHNREVREHNSTLDHLKAHSKFLGLEIRLQEWWGNWWEKNRERLADLAQGRQQEPAPTAFDRTAERLARRQEEVPARRQKDIPARTEEEAPALSRRDIRSKIEGQRSRGDRDKGPDLGR